MSEENIVYCFMNKDFEFIDERANTTDDIKEAIGFGTLEKAKEYRDTLDDPKEWKIVKKRVIFSLEEIVDE